MPERHGEYIPPGVSSSSNAVLQTEIMEKRRATKMLQNRLAIRHVTDDCVMAVIEIISPANKDRKSSIRSFAEKAANLLVSGIHMLIIDPFPLTPRNPQGIHAAIDRALRNRPKPRPVGPPLTLVSYQASEELTAYFQPIGVGDRLIDMRCIWMTTSM